MQRAQVKKDPVLLCGPDDGGQPGGAMKLKADGATHPSSCQHEADHRPPPCAAVLHNPPAATGQPREEEDRED